MRFLQPVGFLYNSNGNTNSNVTLDTVSYVTNGNNNQQLNRNSSHDNSNLRIQQPLIESDININGSTTTTAAYFDDDNPNTITITNNAVTFSKNNFNRLRHNNSTSTTTTLDDNNHTYQQNINNLNLQNFNNKTLNDNEKSFNENNVLQTTADITTNNKLIELVDNIRADQIQVSL